MKKINPFIRWWVTPLLPPEDIFASHNFFSQWVIHPVKRRLARWYLRFLQRYTGIKVVAITGSTGKTTTTEILGAILSTRQKTNWSQEGIDPVYNIPNTILKTAWGTKYLVLEMSVEYVNEMDYYLWLSKPDVAIVTNIAMTHTQFLKNREGVAEEKKKLVKSLTQEGVAVLNMEDPIVKSFAQSTSAKVRWFGSGSDIFAEKIKLGRDLSTSFTLVIGPSKKTVRMNVFGSQFVTNALAAAAAAHSLDINLNDIVRGIEKFKHPSHRLTVIKSPAYGIIFDDSYNSNPKAASESLDTFRSLAGSKTKIAVIGDMLELGKFEEPSHKELGKKVAKMGFDYLIAVGTAVRFTIEEARSSIGADKCFLVSDVAEAVPIVKQLANSNSAIFVKGSRSIALDRLVNALK